MATSCGTVVCVCWRFPSRACCGQSGSVLVGFLHRQKSSVAARTHLAIESFRESSILLYQVYRRIMITELTRDAVVTVPTTFDP